MRVSRIYHPPPIRTGEQLELGSEAAAHVQRVLRLGPGDGLQLFDGVGNEFAANIASLTRGRCQVIVAEPIPAVAESQLKTLLLQGICRGQRMDLVIQKATELGVHRILPLRCERSVVRLSDERGERRRQHWQAVSIAAAEQCGRAQLPRIEAPCSLTQAMTQLPGHGLRILLSPEADKGLEKLPPGDEVALLVGPEGGLTSAEQAEALGAGFASFAMGPRILRTETAALTALAIVQFLHGDLGGA